MAAPVASQEPAAVSATQAATLSAASAASLAVTLEPQKSSADGKVKGVAPVETGGAALDQALPTKTTVQTPPGAATHGGKRADTAPAKPAQAAPGDANENPRPTSAANDAALAGKDQPATPATGHATPGATQAASPAIPLADARPSVPLSTATNPGSHGPEPPAGASQPADIPAPLPSMVPTAQVLERMGHSEMRVDVNTADFGNIQLHTSVSQDRVGASINTTHLDLRTAMMAEAPSLQQALEQHHLRLGQLDLGTQAGERQGGGTAQQQARPQSGWQSGVPSPLPGDTAQPQDSPAPSLLMTPGSSRLNIHA
jgi:flagellar hook-length control protein FliK